MRVYKYTRQEAIDKFREWVRMKIQFDFGAPSEIVEVILRNVIEVLEEKK